MLKISKPIIVEGKYDRQRVLEVVEGTVISTDGFGIFNRSDVSAMIKKLAEKYGVIVLTDSDGGGLVIRNHIKNIVRGENVINVYIPQVEGKERRKKAPSKEGFLGVEGMDAAVIEKLLAPYADGGNAVPKTALTKTDFYELGLSGGKNSAIKREKLAASLGLPRNLSAKALLEAINLTATEEEFKLALMQTEE
ncbi:MAG: DUF4093 domain-containing protein [Clostridia bacterium]|nr:DUF4093 domain-containing protein [Clostridia bacterium]